MKRRTEKILVDSVCTALLLGCVIFLLARWGSIPQQVPAHYNAAGEVDRWGGKWEMLILPGLAALLTGGLTLLEHFPAVWNPGAAVSKENRERVYAVSGRMLRTEKLTLNLCGDHHKFSVDAAPAGLVYTRLSGDCLWNTGCFSVSAVPREITRRSHYAAGASSSSSASRSLSAEKRKRPRAS